tara:strand:+ start:554 stop:874 length:321 start_codon:yes stop_codon:yes gene_type:complete
MATINKLKYDAREFDVLKNNGYFIVMHKATGTIDRFKVRAGNHNEEMKLTFKGFINLEKVRRENNIGQAINGKGTIVKAERQNQVTAKFKRSLVLNHDGNLIRNGG